MEVASLTSTQRVILTLICTSAARGTMVTSSIIQEMVTSGPQWLLLTLVRMLLATVAASTMVATEETGFNLDHPFGDLSDAIMVMLDRTRCQECKRNATATMMTTLARSTTLCRAQAWTATPSSSTGLDPLQSQVPESEFTEDQPTGPSSHCKEESIPGRAAQMNTRPWLTTFMCVEMSSLDRHRVKPWCFSFNGRIGRLTPSLSPHTSLGLPLTSTMLQVSAQSHLTSCATMQAVPRAGHQAQKPANSTSTQDYLRPLEATQEHSTNSLLIDTMLSFSKICTFEQPHGEESLSRSISRLKFVGRRPYLTHPQVETTYTTSIWRTVGLRTPCTSITCVLPTSLSTPITVPSLPATSKDLLAILGSTQPRWAWTPIHSTQGLQSRQMLGRGRAFICTQGQSMEDTIGTTCTLRYVAGRPFRTHLREELCLTRYTIRTQEQGMKATSATPSSPTITTTIAHWRHASWPQLPMAVQLIQPSQLLQDLIWLRLVLRQP